MSCVFPSVALTDLIFQVTGGRLEATQPDDAASDDAEEENTCTTCDMAFISNTVLETHVDEIHEERKAKFTGGFMIVA